MSLLQRLSMSVGLGSAKLSVASVEPQQFRGGAVNGVVMLEGGEGEQEVRMLTVDLTEFWVTGSGRNRSHHTRNHGRITVAEHLTVGSGFRQEYPFQFSLPSAARCSRRSEGWSLNAEAHIPWAVDARAVSILKVLPQPEILAVQRAMKSNFSFAPLSWDGTQLAVYYNFGAPPFLSNVLDGAALRLAIVGDMLNGDLILNRQEHGVGGLLTALVGGDKETIPFVVPRADLLTKRGSPNPAGAYVVLKSLFDRAGLPSPPAPPQP